ncbi:MAG: phosphoglycerate mutase family protein [Gammaproteobacteria bacterium]|nr:phosphoglycerate mutase family protein [Gammaproteobacteria bacterium]
MARMIAALIRHGDYHQLADTPSAWQPFPLNKAGEKHAQSAAQMISDKITQECWQLHSSCHSSQLLRAWQTADIICQQLNKIDTNELHINSFSALAERSVGSAANLNLTQIEAVIKSDPRYELLPKNWKSDSYFCLPLQGAESLMDSGKRVSHHIKQTMLECRHSVNQPTVKLFVGHGAAFRHAAYQLGLLKFEQIAQLSMYHGTPIFIELLEDGSWLHIAGQWKVRGKKTQYRD